MNPERYCFACDTLHAHVCPQAGDATPPAPSELEVLDARRYFGGRLTAEEEAALDAVDLAGVNHAPPATPQPETPMCSDPHLLKRGCECASCLDPKRLKRQLMELWDKHHAFKESVAAALAVENEHGPVSHKAVIEAAHDTLGQLLALSPPPDVERLTPELIDNGNIYVFCDEVDSLNHRSCVRGAGHNGPHAMAAMEGKSGLTLIGPVLLSPSTPGEPSTTPTPGAE